MATKNHLRQKSRLLRIMRLLRRFRPDLPVTYRRNRVLLFPGGHSFFRSLGGAVRRMSRSSAAVPTIAVPTSATPSCSISPPLRRRSSSGRQIKNLLLNDFEKSRRVTVEGHERRGVIARFLEKVINRVDWFL